jgi:hypothetical protein
LRFRVTEPGKQQRSRVSGERRDVSLFVLDGRSVLE